MKKIKTIIVLLSVTLMAASCKIILPVNATSNPVGNKVGTAKATVIVGLYFNQDASIKKAAKAGGITKISTVDIQYGNILGIIRTFETIVTGE